MLAVSHAGEMRVVLDLYRVLRLRGQSGCVLGVYLGDGDVAILRLAVAGNHRNRQPSFTPRGARVVSGKY